MDFQRHVDCYLHLLDNHHIVKFLKRDPCGALCDKYHLIIVFQFFMRADFQKEDYTPKNFFLGLSISHDLYDESRFIKMIIKSYYMDHKDTSTSVFHWEKLLLFRRMRYHGFMEKKVCRQLCQLMHHQAFYKQRKEMHTGVVSTSVLCVKCHCPVNKLYKYMEKRKATCTIDDVMERKGKMLKTDEKLQFFPDGATSTYSSAKSVVASIC